MKKRRLADSALVVVEKQREKQRGKKYEKWAFSLRKVAVDREIFVDLCVFLCIFFRIRRGKVFFGFFCSVFCLFLGICRPVFTKRSESPGRRVEEFWCEMWVACSFSGVAWAGGPVAEPRGPVVWAGGPVAEPRGPVAEPSGPAPPLGQLVSPERTLRALPVSSLLG